MRGGASASCESPSAASVRRAWAGGWPKGPPPPLPTLSRIPRVCWSRRSARATPGRPHPRRSAPRARRRRPTAILARVHDTIAAAADDDDLDLDPSLGACVQHSLRGPHLSAVAPDTEPPPHTVSAYRMQLHAATTVDGRDRSRMGAVGRWANARLASARRPRCATCAARSVAAVGVAGDVEPRAGTRRRSRTARPRAEAVQPRSEPCMF